MKKHKRSTTHTSKLSKPAITPMDQHRHDRFDPAPEAASEDNASYFYTLFSAIVQLTKSTVQHPFYTFSLMLLAQAAKCEAKTDVFVIPNAMSSTISPLPNGNGALIGFERATTNLDVFGVPYTNGLGAEFPISSDTAGDQTELDFSEYDPVNGFSATWTDVSTGLIEGRHFSADFTATGPDYTVSNNGLGTQQHPHVEMDLTGTLTYLWDQQNPGSTWNVHSQSFDMNDMPVGSDTVLSTETTDSPRNPSSAMSSGGIVNSVWNTNRQIPIPTTGATFIGDMIQGGGLAAAFDGNTNQPFSASATLTTVGPTTGYVGLHWPTPQTITGVRTFGASDQGYTLSAGGTTTIDLRGSDINPTAPADGTGLGFIAMNRPDVNNADPLTVRTGIDTTTPYGYHFLRFQTGGDPSVAEVVFETSDNRIHSSILGSANTTDISGINFNQLANPVTRAFPDGTFGVAWINRNPMNGDNTIFYQHLNSAGIPTGPVVQVNTQTNATVDHLTIETYDNGAFIGWNSGQSFFSNFVDSSNRLRSENDYLIGTSNSSTNPAARRIDSNTLLTTWDTNSTVQGTTLTTGLSVTVPNEPVGYEESRPVGVTGITVDQAPEFIDAMFATLTLSDPAAGELTADDSGTATFNFDPTTGIGTASGSQVDLNNLLSTLQFRSNPDFTDNVDLQFDVDGGPSLASSTIALNNIPSNTNTNTNATSNGSSDNAGLIAGIIIAILAACGIPACGIISYLLYRSRHTKAHIPSEAIEVDEKYFLRVANEEELKELQQQLGYEFETEKDNKGAFGDNGLYKKYDPFNPTAEPEYFFGKYSKIKATQYPGSIEHHVSPLSLRINDITLDTGKQFKLVYYMESQTWHIIYKKQNYLQIETIPRDFKDLKDTNPTLFALAKKLYKEDPQQDIEGKLIENRLADYEELAAFHAGETDQTNFDEIVNEIEFLKTFRKFPKHMLVPEAMEIKRDQAIMMMPIAGFGNGATLWSKLNKIADEIEILDNRKQHLELLIQQDHPIYQSVKGVNQQTLDKTHERISFLKTVHQGLTLRVSLALLDNAAEFHQDKASSGPYQVHLDTHLGNMVFKLKKDEADEGNDDYINLIDFNRSEFHKSKEELSTGVRGAYFITSPEALQAHVDGKPYDGRASDLFAIGICALELVLGLRAHQGAKHFKDFDLDKHASLLDQYTFIYNRWKAYAKNPFKQEKPEMTILQAYQKAMKPIFALPEFKNPAEGSLFWAIKVLLSENPMSRLCASKISSKVREFNKLAVNELPFDRHQEINLRVLLSQLKSNKFYQEYPSNCEDLQKLPETIEKPKARSASLVRLNPQSMPRWDAIPKDVSLYPQREDENNEDLYQNTKEEEGPHSSNDHFAQSGNFSTIAQEPTHNGVVYFEKGQDLQPVYNNQVLYNNPKSQKQGNFSLGNNGHALMAAPKNGVHGNAFDRENGKQNGLYHN